MSVCLHVYQSKGLRGTCTIPGDKSISHRSVILGGIADGISRVSRFLLGSDCLATVNAMRSLGVRIEMESSELEIHGRGLGGLIAPVTPVDCDNSGTTMRLLAGLLAGQSFSSQLVGTDQLSSRPMSRIVMPLEEMGARIESTSGNAPLNIQGGNMRGARLHGIRHEMKVASAQVKSCILLSGLYADSKTTVIEKGPSRDHTERMLRAMGADITIKGSSITLFPNQKGLAPFELTVPGDMSSAAFLMVAASIVPKSNITIRNVGMNPTRIGILDALVRMGADIEITRESVLGGEPVADLTVRSSKLVGATFEGDEIVTMIDELPTLAVAATQARGQTIIRGAKELRVKETDRIATTAGELRKLGAKIEELEDGMVIEGKSSLNCAVVKSWGDHRLAMLLAVAGLVASNKTTVEGASVTKDSFPGFEACLTSLGAEIEIGDQ